MKFYGQFDPPVDKFLYERYFQDFKGKGFFIECGAFDGNTECSCKFFEETLNWSGINIEPSPPIFECLKINRPNSKNINVALSSEKGSSTFNQPVHPVFHEQCTNGSLQHLPQHKEWLLSIGCTFKEYVVPTITWCDLITEQHIKKVDLLVLDVEGNELEAIKGMIGSTVLPKIICIEHGQLGLEVIKEALCPFGYEYDTSSHVNSFFVLKNSIRRYKYIGKAIIFKLLGIQ